MSTTYAPASWVFGASAGLWLVIFVIGCVLIAKAHSTGKRSGRSGAAKIESAGA